MSKRAFLLLLLPSMMFLLVAAESFRFARLIAPDEKFTQKVVDKLTREAQSGDYGPKPDLLVERLSDSWRAQDALRSDNAKMYVITGWAILAVVAVQVYLILRLKFGFRKRDA